MTLEGLRKHGWLRRTDVEVIVIDNGSVRELPRCIGEMYPSVIVLCMATGGKSAAMNHGVKSSRGQYIAFIDDDVLPTNDDWLDRLRAHFTSNPRLGYVSGNVFAASTESKAQVIWERRGGLSKGPNSKFFSAEELANDYKSAPWPLHEIFVGANSMIPRKVLEHIGLFHLLFDGGARIPACGMLEFGYRVVRGGYDVMYDSTAIVSHQHPASSWQLRRKFFAYALSGSALHLYFAKAYLDSRSARFGYTGNFLGFLGMLPRSFRNLGAPPPTFLIPSILGALIGTALGILLFAPKATRKTRAPKLPKGTTPGHDSTPLHSINRI
jgi:GT2 family glycosyltransferase